MSLRDKVLVEGGLQEGASERRKQKLPPSKQSQFQPGTCKVKHLQGFHLLQVLMLKTGLLEWYTATQANFSTYIKLMKLDILYIKGPKIQQ